MEFGNSQLDDLWKGNQPDHIYWYKNQSGECIGGVARWDAKTQDGSKTIRFIRNVGVTQDLECWKYGAIQTPRPLYCLPSIVNNTDAIVMIVEGEKTAEAAQNLFPDYVVTTTMGGANASHKTDFAPLEGRHIIICPDNDDAGKAYVQNVVDLCLQAKVASIKILSMNVFASFQILEGILIARSESLPQGYDLADALDEGWTLELVQEAQNQLGEFYINITAHTKQISSLKFWNESEVGHVSESSEDLPLGYTLTANGLYYDDYWLCSYIKVLALTRDELNQNWGRLIELTDPDGKIHAFTIPMAELAGDSNELIKRLLSLGLRMEGGQKARNKLVNFFQNTSLDKRIVCVPKIGWHHEHFVFPSEVVPTTNALVLQSDIGEFAGHTTAGSLQEWQDHIALPCRGNSRLLLALSSAFAAPLLSLLHHENFGFHFKGSSSIGKTTALQVATSVWGNPKLQESWKATANALEAVAVSHNDSLLCLDELGQADGKDVGEVVYMLANGAGKNRMKARGDLRKKLTWKTLVLSTGEISIETKLNEFNRKLQAGMSTRLIEIPADTESGQRLFDNIHQFKQSSEFANHLKKHTRSYYGNAIRNFLKAIRAYQEQLPQRLDVMNDQLLSQFATDKWSGQEKRVLKHFAFVALAGELAIEMRILPYKQNEVFNGVVQCFQTWLTTRGDLGDQELAAGIAQVRRFFEENHSSRFVWNDKNVFEKPISNLAGYKNNVYSYSEEVGIEFFVYPETFRKEICKGFNAQEILREFARRGILKRANDRQLVSEKRLPIGKKKIYHFLPTILADSEEYDLNINTFATQKYGQTGGAEGYTCGLTAISKGDSVALNGIRQDEPWGDGGDNDDDMGIVIHTMSPLSPSMCTTKFSDKDASSASKIKGFRGVPPLSSDVTPKNAMLGNLGELTDATYAQEELLAIQNDSIVSQHN